MINPQRLTQAREARGLTQAQLAAAMGISRSAVTQWESGETHPDPASLDQLAIALNASLDYLYGLTDDGDDRAERFVDSDSHGKDKFGPVDWAQLKRVPITGRVQAGVFAKGNELEPDERSFAYIPVDLPYANLPLAGFLVVGDSMNEFYPHGTRLIVAPAIHLGEGWMPRSGQHVIVQRLNDWGETELTVKEIRYGPQSTGGPTDGREPTHFELWPRSTNKSFTEAWRFPISRSADAGDDEKMRIVGLVVHYVGKAPGV
jgi:transcriptional regulator with XRE-family HTH domain